MRPDIREYGTILSGNTVVASTWALEKVVFVLVSAIWPMVDFEAPETDHITCWAFCALIDAYRMSFEL